MIWSKRSSSPGSWIQIVQLLVICQTNRGKAMQTSCLQTSQVIFHLTSRIARVWMCVNVSYCWCACGTLAPPISMWMMSWSFEVLWLVGRREYKQYGAPRPAVEAHRLSGGTGSHVVMWTSTSHTQLCLAHEASNWAEQMLIFNFYVT